MKEFFTLLSFKFGNRGTSQKKSKFLNWYLPQVKKLGYAVNVNAGKGDFSRICNVVIGDLKQAKYLLIVPYDTPVYTFVKIPYFPLDPQKSQKYTFRCMMFQLCLSILLALLSLMIFYQGLQMASIYDYMKLLCGGILFLVSIGVGKGVSNRNNFNRNNAAVSIFTQILSEKPSNTAFVLVDCVSGSLKGYGLLRETYGKSLRHLHTIMLDCVGSGEHGAIASSLDCPKENWKPSWCSLSEELESVRELFSSISIVARGTLNKSVLKVMHTGSYKDREVDFDQMEEVVNIVKEMI